MFRYNYRNYSSKLKLWELLKCFLSLIENIWIKHFFSLIGVKKYIENDLYFYDSNNYGVYEYVNNKIESYCSAKHIFNSENLNLTESIKDLV